MAGSFDARVPTWVKPASCWPIWHPDMTWETEHFRGRFVEPGDAEALPGDKPVGMPEMLGPAGGELLVVAWALLPTRGEHKAYWEDVEGAMLATYRLPSGPDRRISFPVVVGMAREPMSRLAERHARHIVEEWRNRGARRPTMLTRADITRELAPIYKAVEATSPTPEVV